ncbi:MAG: fibronectin type III domain-containing protein [Cyclobacteriaceae bacterium]
MSEVKVKWKSNSINPSDFVVERTSKSLIEGTEEIEVLGGLTELIDTDLAPDNNYSYRVKAIESNTETPYTQKAEVFTLMHNTIAQLQGDLLEDNTESSVADGFDLIVTLKEPPGGDSLLVDAFAATLGADNAITTAFITGLKAYSSLLQSALSALTHTNITRDSDTQVTITVPAFNYDVTADDEISLKIPATALQGGVALKCSNVLPILDQTSELLSLENWFDFRTNRYMYDVNELIVTDGEGINEVRSRVNTNRWMTGGLANPANWNQADKAMQMDGVARYSWASEAGQVRQVFEGELHVFFRIKLVADTFPLIEDNTSQAASLLLVASTIITLRIDGAANVTFPCDIAFGRDLIIELKRYEDPNTPSDYIHELYIDGDLIGTHTQSGGFGVLFICGRSGSASAAGNQVSDIRFYRKVKSAQQADTIRLFMNDFIFITDSLATIGGTILTNNSRTDILAGGETIDVLLRAAPDLDASLSNKWSNILGQDNQITNSFINSLNTSFAQLQSLFDLLDYTHITRVDDFTARITLPPKADYLNTEEESFNLILPASVFQDGGSPLTTLNTAIITYSPIELSNADFFFDARTNEFLEDSLGGDVTDGEEILKIFSRIGGLFLTGGAGYTTPWNEARKAIVFDGTGGYNISSIGGTFLANYPGELHIFWKGTVVGSCQIVTGNTSPQSFFLAQETGCLLRINGGTNQSIGAAIASGTNLVVELKRYESQITPGDYIHEIYYDGVLQGSYTQAGDFKINQVMTRGNTFSSNGSEMNVCAIYNVVKSSSDSEIIRQLLV